MRWPPYAADLTVELHQNRKTNEAFVKVSYVGEVGAENVSQDEQKQKKKLHFFFLSITSSYFFFLQDQLIGGCSAVYCPLEEFKRVLSTYSLSPEDYHSHCNRTVGPTEP